METFLRLFGSLLALVYHCFDRIVIFGYLPLLSRPEHIVHFFRDVQGHADQHALHERWCFHFLASRLGCDRLVRSLLRSASLCSAIASWADSDLRC